MKKCACVGDYCEYKVRKFQHTFQTHYPLLLTYRFKLLGENANTVRKKTEPLEVASK